MALVYSRNFKTTTRTEVNMALAGMVLSKSEMEQEPLIKRRSSQTSSWNLVVHNQYTSEQSHILKFFKTSLWLRPLSGFLYNVTKLDPINVFPCFSFPNFRKCWGRMQSWNSLKRFHLVIVKWWIHLFVSVTFPVAPKNEFHWFYLLAKNRNLWCKFMKLEDDGLRYSKFWIF